MLAEKKNIMALDILSSVYCCSSEDISCIAINSGVLIATITITIAMRNRTTKFKSNDLSWGGSHITIYSKLILDAELSDKVIITVSKY